PPQFHGNGTPLTYGMPYLNKIFWRNGQPLVLLLSLEDLFQVGSYSRIWTYQRQPNGTWLRTLGWDGTHPQGQTDLGGSLTGATSLPDKTLLVLGNERIGTSSDWRIHYYGLYDDSSPWRAVFTGYWSPDGWSGADPRLVTLDAQGTP